MVFPAPTLLFVTSGSSLPAAPHPVEGVEPEVYGHLENFPFRGNVRELENMVERALALCEGPRLGIQDFPPAPLKESSSPAPEGPPGKLEEQVARLEIPLIRSAPARHRGNKNAAAREPGLSERAIRYKIKKYRLEQRRKNLQYLSLVFPRLDVFVGCDDVFVENGLAIFCAVLKTPFFPDSLSATAALARLLLHPSG